MLLLFRTDYILILLITMTSQKIQIRRGLHTFIFNKIWCLHVFRYYLFCFQLPSACFLSQSEPLWNQVIVWLAACWVSTQKGFPSPQARPRVDNHMIVSGKGIFIFISGHRLQTSDEIYLQSPCGLIHPYPGSKEPHSS